MRKLHKKLLRANETVAPGSAKLVYDDRINELIRTRYSLSEELSILRKRDTHPEEFAAYNSFAESCKAQAREEFNI